MKHDAFQLLAEVAASDGLPQRARTRTGVEFDASSDHWAYRDGTHKVSINFQRLPNVTPELKHSLKRITLLLAETSAASGLSANYDSIVRLINAVAAQRSPVAHLEGLDYLNFHAADKIGRQTGHLRSILRKWHDLGITGLHSDMQNALMSVKLNTPPKGVAVATMDPKKGPLTDIEFEALLQALNEAYRTGNMSPAMFVLSWLFIATGARPAQLAAMKVKDVHRREVEGAVDFSIDIPRAKQGTLPRTGFKNRPLVKALGELLVRYASSVREALAGDVDEPDDAPLFPSQYTLGLWAPGFEYHHTAAGLGKLLCGKLSRLRVVSERTGAAMRVNALRLRRTFGTRAAQEGLSAFVIAELLDHQDTQSVGVYVESRPDIARRIDKAVALELAPLAQAFVGKLISSEAAATRSGDHSSRIRDLRISTEPIASCGQHSFCGMSAPLACYTCISFEPWLDGPHEAVLDALIANRERQLGTASARVATVHDRTITAVAQVVLLCRRQKGLGGNSGL